MRASTHPLEISKKNFPHPDISKRIEHQPCHKKELPVDPEERRQTYSVARLDKQYCGPPPQQQLKTFFSRTTAFDSPRTASPDRSNSIHKTNQHHRHTQKIENIGLPHYSSKKVIIHKKEKEQQNLARFEANSPVFDP